MLTLTHGELEPEHGNALIHDVMFEYQGGRDAPNNTLTKNFPNIVLFTIERR